MGVGGNPSDFVPSCEGQNLFLLEIIMSIHIQSKCRCVTAIYQDYNDAKNVKEYLGRIKQGIKSRQAIIEHEETCPVFNGEFNQFLMRGSTR